MKVRMWNNPRLLNAAANALFALAFALVAYGGTRLLVHSSAFVLSTIRVQGQLQHVTRDDVMSALQGRVSGTFFSVDLETIRALFEGIPWVRRAEVRRLWPDRIEVRVEEHVALARWGQGQDGHLVNTYGELFSGRADARLPLFSGPAGSESEVAHRYGVFRQLLAPLQLIPQQVLLSPRYAWQLRLSNGLVVQLGRESDKDRIADRLARFVSVYTQTLGKLARRLDYVDLRYPNGFALRLPEMLNSESRKRRQA
ncbi:MAG: cell division protein FtsQ/DivIB [Burkholderiales bacterium]